VQFQLRLQESRGDFGAQEEARMWRRFRRSAQQETDDVRGGGGPLDNLVVLSISLVVQAIVGALLLWYFGYFPGGHPAVTERG
jgi:hypothetical protein